MFGAIHRVVSQSDDVGGEVAPPTSPGEAAAPNNTTTTPSTAAASPDAVVVEPDRVPVVMVESSDDADQDAHMSSSSTLSDTSIVGDNNNNNAERQGDDVLMTEVTSPGHQSNNNPRVVVVQGMRDSAADENYDQSSTGGSSSASSLRYTNSQTSSRDWGWFEDVHQSIHDDTKQNTEKKKDSNNKGGEEEVDADGRPKTINKKRTKTRGLVPQVSGGEVGAILQPRKTPEDAAAMAVTAPTYVLEESLSSQRLWKDTAGNRPPQPMEERAFYEKMWAQNFARSQVKYDMPADVLMATSPIWISPFADGNFEGPSSSQLVGGYEKIATPSTDSSDVAEHALISRMNDPNAGGHRADHELNQHHQQVINRRVHGSDGGDMIVLVRGDNVFGTTVSKSFARPDKLGVDTVNISIASYRVVESKKYGKYAQFLVIYREGSIRDTVGVWKRYSDFEELARTVTHAHEGCASVIANMSPLAVTEEAETEHLPNAITSWRLLKKRQRWYRCLDAGYLSLKVFLLERFLHDILFESSSPKLLRDFVAADVGAEEA